MGSDHEGFGDKTIPRKIQQFGGLFRAQRNRFFAKNMLSRFNGLNGHRHMHVVRQRVVDHIDIGIGEQLFIGSIRLFDPKRVCGFPGPILITRSNGCGDACL